MNLLMAVVRVFPLSCTCMRFFQGAFPFSRLSTTNYADKRIKYNETSFWNAKRNGGTPNAVAERQYCY